MFFHEFEMLDHRMAGKSPEPAGHAQHHRLRVRALEFDLAFAEIGLDAVKRAKEIVIPEGAAEFAVGDGLQPDVLLLFDDRVDFSVFHRFQFGGGDLPALALGARIFQRRGTKKTSDMVGAEGGRSALGQVWCTP